MSPCCVSPHEAFAWETRPVGRPLRSQRLSHLSPMSPPLSMCEARRETQGELPGGWYNVCFFGVVLFVVFCFGGRVVGPFVGLVWPHIGKLGQPCLDVLK